MTSFWWAKLSLVVVKKRINSHNIRGQLNSPSPSTLIDTQVTKPEWWVYSFTRLCYYNAWLDILGGFSWYSPDILELGVLEVNIAYDVGTFKSKIYPPSLYEPGLKLDCSWNCEWTGYKLMHMVSDEYAQHVHDIFPISHTIFTAWLISSLFGTADMTSSWWASSSSRILHPHLLQCHVWHLGTAWGWDHMQQLTYTLYMPPLL